MRCFTRVFQALGKQRQENFTSPRLASAMWWEPPSQNKASMYCTLIKYWGVFESVVLGGYRRKAEFHLVCCGTPGPFYLDTCWSVSPWLITPLVSPCFYLALACLESGCTGYYFSLEMSCLSTSLNPSHFLKGDFQCHLLFVPFIQQWHISEVLFKLPEAAAPRQQAPYVLPPIYLLL